MYYSCKLPLVAGRLLKTEIVELRPCVNWSRMFAGIPANGDERRDQRLSHILQDLIDAQSDDETRPPSN